MNKLVVSVVLVLMVGSLFSCRTAAVSSYRPEHKFSPSKQQADLDLLKNILETSHPSLYWYTPKDSVDYYFAQTRNAAADSLTEREYKNRVSWLIAKIRCGHTAVRHSKQYAKYYDRRREPVFPLSLKIWDDSAVVLNNLVRTDSLFKRGTIITGINGYTTRQLIDSLTQLIGTDGYSTNFKYQLISFNFPAYYRNAFGVDSQYSVHYLDSLGNDRSAVVKNFIPPKDSPRRVPGLGPPLTKKEKRKLSALSKRNFTVDTSLNAAIISVNTFSEGHLRNFYRTSFRQVRKQQIENVVLDLRQNSGGSVLLSTRFCQYLVDKPFRIADTVAAPNRSFEYRKFIHPWFLYWLSMHVTGHKMEDGRIHFRFFERHYFKPKNKNHFDGNIYVVTGGYTFSAATLVTGALKGQQNVTVVGEETGGGAYGNSAMHLPVIVLPETGLKITLPLYRIVLNRNLPKNGRGIMPDVEVKPGSVYIKQGIDPKMKQVSELILSVKKKSVL